jgi:hypothetical protein
MDWPNRQDKTPNDLKTRFRIGSMNKMFTATATLQLAQANILEVSPSIDFDKSDPNNCFTVGKEAFGCSLLHLLCPPPLSKWRRSARHDR